MEIAPLPGKTIRPASVIGCSFLGLRLKLFLLQSAETTMPGATVPSTAPPDSELGGLFLITSSVAYLSQAGHAHPAPSCTAQSTCLVARQEQAWEKFQLEGTWKPVVSVLP